MPAYKPVRRGQLISPFGVGAMVDFPGDESLMTAGLDAWPFADEECPDDWLVMEERLQVRLNTNHFRLPPEHRDPGPGVKYPNQDIPYVRFPRWHYCHRCGDMHILPLFETGRQRCRGVQFDQGMNCASLPERRRPYLIPLRIVAACRLGHIQDFPFMEWVHQDRLPSAECSLRFRAGRSSASLGGIKISCSCGAEKTLAGVFNFDIDKGGALHRIGQDCRGSRPWLGEDGGSNHCGEYLRVVQRGASNVYFSNVVSSIYLPLWAEKSKQAVVDALENPKYWGILTNGLVDGTRIDPAKAKVVAEMLDLSSTDLIETGQRRLDGVPAVEELDSEEAYRRQEYNALRAGRGGPETELLVDVREAESYDRRISASKFFSQICLVRKLRETRVLAGFTRLLPPSGNMAPDSVQALRSGPHAAWLPAIIVRGEGMFFEFNLAQINKWLACSNADARIANMANIYNQNRVQRGQAERSITPKFVMIHTLAHMLINQLAFDCGYGSASIRERIYCESEPDSEPMQGLLLYTASGDSEGTMGGLVRQGEPDRLPETLMRALRRAQWCSSDPVCIESKGQGTDNSNLAACHACVLVSETSCEEGNRMLDRAMVVGRPKYPGSGYFSSLV